MTRSERVISRTAKWQFSKVLMKRFGLDVRSREKYIKWAAADTAKKGGKKWAPRPATTGGYRFNKSSDDVCV
jgi:hypothetical protein